MAIRKKYNSENEEDVNGWRVGAEHTDASGNKFKCMYTRFMHHDLEARGAVPLFYFFTKAVGTDLWIKKTPDLTTNVDETEYRYESQQKFAQLEPEPFEDDLNSPIYGPIPEPTEEDPDPVAPLLGYDQKLKAGLVTEAAFFVYAVYQGRYGVFPLDEILFSTILEINGWTED